MAVMIDVSKNYFLQELLNRLKEYKDLEAMKEIVRSQVVTKYHRVPKWAEARLVNGTKQDVVGWAKKVLTAPTLEGVLGKR